MNNFNWKEFKNEDIAVWCDTREVCMNFLAECKKQGIIWASGEELCELDYSERYQFHIHQYGKGLYRDKTALIENFKVVKWEIEDGSSNLDIKVEQVVKYKNGDTYSYGVVIEIFKILDSVNKENKGKTMYQLDEYDVISEDDILEVYGLVDRVRK